MAEASTDPSPLNHEVVYPKPAGWEYMTHEERYAALRSAPKPDSAALRTALSHAKQQVLRDRGDERRAFQEAREAYILADAPRFTLALTGAPTLSLSEPSYPITATLTYASDPTPKNPRSVLFRPSYGPLAASAPNENLYSVYTTPTCRPESRILRLRPNASLRPPREPDGSFTEEMEVATWDGWEEVSVGDTVRREVVLGLDERNGWRRYLEKGKSYWLRSDDAGRLGVDRYWRYGRKCEVELPVGIKLRDPGAVTIPLEPSNVVEFEAVE